MEDLPPPQKNVSLRGVDLPECGRFKDFRFYTTLNFGFFLGPPIFSMFLLHGEFWPFLAPSPSPRCLGFTANFGTPLFQLLEALCWPKRRPQSFFYPTRNFGLFFGPPSKMSLNFSKILGRLRRHTQCPLSLVSSSASSSCLLLWPWLCSLSHGGPLFPARCARFGMAASSNGHWIP